MVNFASQVNGGGLMQETRFYRSDFKHGDLVKKMR